MISDPKLSVAEATGQVHGLALVMHGGRATSRLPVRGRHLAVLRMRPFISSLRRHAGDGLAVADLQYRVRGWNGDDRSPVPDTLWALDRLAERFPAVPVALVGHSMGGRAAIHAAAHDGVRAVVALAPWIEAGDPVEPLAGRRVLIAHGDGDRVTDPRASAAFARRAEQVAASATYVRVAGQHHAMLRRATLWHELATGFVIATVLGRTPNGFRGKAAAEVLAAAIAGQPALVI